MTGEAISTFLFLTETSYDYGLITGRIYTERIIQLYDLIGHDASDFYDVAYSEEKQEGFEADVYQKGDDTKESTMQTLGLANAIKINEEVYSQNNVLYFLTSREGKFCRWKFNEYDADDKPSIPHGHGIERKNVKLDPYRALIYDISKGFDKPISKEDDDFIVYLWNNNDFRNCATLAIKHHITSLHKHSLYWTDYRGLSHSPFRLPRRKR